MSLNRRETTQCEHPPVRKHDRGEHTRYQITIPFAWSKVNIILGFNFCQEVQSFRLISNMIYDFFLTFLKEWWKNNQHHIVEDINIFNNRTIFNIMSHVNTLYSWLYNTFAYICLYAVNGCIKLIFQAMTMGIYGVGLLNFTFKITCNSMNSKIFQG